MVPYCACPSDEHLPITKHAYLIMGKHGYGPTRTERLGSRSCIITGGLLPPATKNRNLFPLPICILISYLWPLCDVKDIITIATISKRMILHMCFSVMGGPKIRHPNDHHSVDWSYIWEGPHRWWSLMGFGRLYTTYWPPPYVGYRCSSRAALFTTLYVRPWRGGEARSMDISLRRSYPGLPWDMVNIVASYMPEKAKSWTKTLKGKVIRMGLS